MKFPLIKRANITPSAAIGAAFDKLVSENGIDAAIAGKDAAALKLFSDSYLMHYNAKVADGIVGRDLIRMVNILQTLGGAIPQAPAATQAAPAATQKVEAPKKAGPHAGMKLVQEKFNAFLKGKNSEDRVPVNGNQGDSTTWKVMKGVFPEWFEGGVKFKNYKQLAGWLDAKMTEVSSGSPAAAPAMQRGAGEGRALVAAWRNFLSAYPYPKFNPENIVYKTFFTGEPANVAAKAAAFASDTNYAKIPVKAFAEQTVVLLKENLVGGAVKKLNEGTAAAKAQKTLHERANKTFS